MCIEERERTVDYDLDDETDRDDRLSRDPWPIRTRTSATGLSITTARVSNSEPAETEKD